MAIFYLTLSLLVWSPWSDVSSYDLLDPDEDENDNSDDDEDSDFIEHYESEGDLTSTISELHTRIRRYEAKSSSGQTLKPDEIDDIKDILKQVLAGREINLPSILATKFETSEGTSIIYDYSTKGPEFTGLTKMDQTKLYEDIVEEIIDSANRQGLLTTNDEIKIDNLIIPTNSRILDDHTRQMPNESTCLDTTIAVRSVQTLRTPTRSLESDSLNRRKNDIVTYSTKWTAEHPSTNSLKPTEKLSSKLIYAPTQPLSTVKPTLVKADERHIRLWNEEAARARSLTRTSQRVEHATKITKTLLMQSAHYFHGTYKEKAPIGIQSKQWRHFQSLSVSRSSQGQQLKKKPLLRKLRPPTQSRRSTYITNATTTTPTCATCKRKTPRTKTRSKRTTTTTTIPPPKLDIPYLVNLVANLTADFTNKVVEMFNETLQKHNIPTCGVPTTTTTEETIHELTNATVISKCFVCGLQMPGVPENAYCADAFAGDFLPLVPVDAKARGQIANYRKYCRYLDVGGFMQHRSEPRSVYGRFTGGCSVRWIDLSGIYTQRACRNRRRAMRGRHFCSKRMAKLEMALKIWGQMAVLYLTLFYLILWPPWSDVSSDDYLDPADNSEDDEDSDFIEHYDLTADLKSRDKGDFHTRIRRFDAKSSTGRTLDAEEVDDIRDILKQVLAGRVNKINLPVTSIRHVHDRSTKDHEFTGLTKFYDDIIEEIIDNANRQGLLPINNASKSDTWMFSENDDPRKFTEVSEHRYTGTALRRMIPAVLSKILEEPFGSFEKVFLNRHETSVISYRTTRIVENPTTETTSDTSPDLSSETNLPSTLPSFIVYLSSDTSHEIHVGRQGDPTITTPGSTLTISFIERTEMNPPTTTHVTSYKKYDRDGGDREKDAGGDRDKDGGGDRDKDAGGERDKDGGGDRDKDAGGERDKDGGGDRDKVGGGERDKVGGGDRDKVGGGDRDKVGGGDRDNVGGSDRDKVGGGDRDKVGGGDRDRYDVGDRDRYDVGDRDKYGGGDRDKYGGGDRDRYDPGDRDKYGGGDRDKYGDRDRDKYGGGDRDKYLTTKVTKIIETTTIETTTCSNCPTCRKKPPRKKTRSSTTTTTLPTTTMPAHFDVSALVELVANFSSLYEKDIVEMFNETLQKYSIPTCSVPTTTTTEAPVYELTNATIVAKCFVCGMETPGIPRRAYCGDAFAGDFLPLVPVDPKARGQIANYRKYCRYLDVNGYLQHHTEPRSVFGRFTGGCSVRWIDLSGIYTQRACRNRRRAMRGRHFGSKRMAKLEMALKEVDNGCVISPMASLVPLSRGISLYARFHACVCTGSWCNVTSTNRLRTPYMAVLTIWLIFGSTSCNIRENKS